MAGLNGTRVMVACVCYATFMRSLSPLLAVGAALLVAGCHDRTDPAPASNLSESPAPAPETSAQLPTVDQPLTRRDLLLATIEAASAAAIGTDDADQQRALDGRTFSLRIRWCAGDRALTQSFDGAKRVLKVALSPDVDRSSPPLAGLGGDKDEASGFWLPRPWMLTPACAAPAAESPPVPTTEASPLSSVTDRAPVADKALIKGLATPSSPVATPAGPADPAHSVGVVEWFKADDPRVGRNHRRSFAITRRLGEDEQFGPVDLVIEGRLSALSDGKVIRCLAVPPSRPPSCLISVRIDRARLEGPRGKLLAEWSDS